MNFGQIPRTHFRRSRRNRRTVRPRGLCRQRVRVFALTLPPSSASDGEPRSSARNREARYETCRKHRASRPPLSRGSPLEAAKPRSAPAWPNPPRRPIRAPSPRMPCIRGRHGRLAHHPRCHGPHPAPIRTRSAPACAPPVAENHRTNYAGPANPEPLGNRNLLFHRPAPSAMKPLNYSALRHLLLLVLLSMLLPVAASAQIR